MNGEMDKNVSEPCVIGQLDMGNRRLGKMERFFFCADNTRGRIINLPNEQMVLVDGVYFETKQERDE